MRSWEGAGRGRDERRTSLFDIVRSEWRREDFIDWCSESSPRPITHMSHPSSLFRSVSAESGIRCETQLEASY